MAAQNVGVNLRLLLPKSHISAIRIVGVSSTEGAGNNKIIKKCEATLYD